VDLKLQSVLHNAVSSHFSWNDDAGFGSLTESKCSTAADHPYPPNYVWRWVITTNALGLPGKIISQVTQVSGLLSQW